MARMNDREGAHGRRDRAPLLGRDRELDLLVELLDEAPRGGGRHALVVGAAGIGKSRLLRELEEIARRTGVRTLAASGDPLTTDAAFGTLLELIAPLAAGGAGAAGGGARTAGAD